MLFRSVVEILERRYIDLERMAQMSEDTSACVGLSRSVRVERGLAPATGFERTEPTHGMVDSADFLTSIASARQEAQTMFELSQDLGAGLAAPQPASIASMLPGVAGIVHNDALERRVEALEQSAARQDRVFRRLLDLLSAVADR